jgi:hypothetical protein
MIKRNFAGPAGDAVDLPVPVRDLSLVVAAVIGVLLRVPAWR